MSQLPLMAGHVRRFKLTTVATQIRIAEAHNLIPLANPDGLLLSHEEEDMLFLIARTCWRHWFTNTTSDKVADSPGRLGAGVLMHEVYRCMSDMVRRQTGVAWCARACCVAA